MINYGGMAEMSMEAEVARAAAPASAPETSASANAGGAPEVQTRKLDLKIEQAKQQGRSKFEEGLKAVKTKIDKFFQRINALPKEIMGIAKEAVAESFAVGARAEVALDTLNQKIDAAQAAMDKKIEDAKKEIAARKQEAERKALAAIDRVINGTRKFFGEIGGSLFAGSRSKENEEFGAAIQAFIDAYRASGKGEVPADLFKTVVEQVRDRQAQYRKNADLINRFLDSFVTKKYTFVMV